MEKTEFLKKHNLTEADYRNLQRFGEVMNVCENLSTCRWGEGNAENYVFYSKKVAEDIMKQYKEADKENEALRNFLKIQKWEEIID